MRTTATDKLIPFPPCIHTSARTQRNAAAKPQDAINALDIVLKEVCVCVCARVCVCMRTSARGGR